MNCIIPNQMLNYKAPNNTPRKCYASISLKYSWKPFFVNFAPANFKMTEKSTDKHSGQSSLIKEREESKHIQEYSLLLMQVIPIVAINMSFFGLLIVFFVVPSSDEQASKTTDTFRPKKHLFFIHRRVMLFLILATLSCSVLIQMLYLYFCCVTKRREMARQIRVAPHTV